jgi:hypothetical protein
VLTFAFNALDLNSYKLAAYIAVYLEKQRDFATEETVPLQKDIAQTLSTVLIPDPKNSENCRNRRGIKSRTARNWLHRLGYSWRDIKKGVFIDGHERPDVIQSRWEFLGQMKDLEPYLVEFNADGTIKEKEYPPDCKVFGDRRRPVIIIVHDESTFNANDGKHQAWMLDGHNPLRPKGKGKGIMVSEFLLPWGRLNLRHLAEPDRQRLNDQRVPTDATVFYEYGATGKGYWDGEDLLQQVTEKALPIAQALYPGYEIVWIFDNATSHSVYKEDALRVNHMGLYPGGVQPFLRDGWWLPFGEAERVIHPMVHTEDPEYLLNLPGAHITWKQKGIRMVLEERDLWPEGGLLLECPRLRCSECTAVANCGECVKGKRCDSCKAPKVHTSDDCSKQRKCDGCIERAQRCSCSHKKRCDRCQSRKGIKCDACDSLPPRCTSDCE